MGWGIEMEWGSASLKAEGGEKSHEAEDMIAMHVADEDGIELGETDVGTPYLRLYAFSTVNHKVLAPDLDNLR